MYIVSSPSSCNRLSSFCSASKLAPPKFLMDISWSQSPAKQNSWTQAIFFLLPVPWIVNPLHTPECWLLLSELHLFSGTPRSPHQVFYHFEKEIQWPGKASMSLYYQCGFIAKEISKHPLLSSSLEIWQLEKERAEITIGERAMWYCWEV